MYLCTSGCRNLVCLCVFVCVCNPGCLTLLCVYLEIQVQEVFRRFYFGRIGIRLLVDTHLALRSDVLGACMYVYVCM